ncbi:Bacteriophytochrome (light-regulated signal transduction histidine kinase) [Sphingomonas palmae]|uniref:Bacteriophytochrome (Light-regulated signal transduction histidine kinase) n=1 Tax=Sphingomonas palmae TaxID=1855283 RepID=A0A1H7U597_9SPHN|nr:Bacteriophytochrome (light-regulated signal transduction histidine kinase) [Sphingomonas palmae]
MAGDGLAAREVGVAAQLDLTTCDREPIHIPGAVQPHGLLLIAEPQTLTIVAGAGDIEGVLSPDWLGLTLSDVLGIDVAAVLERAAAGPGGTVIGGVVHGHDLAFHRSGAYLLAELEPVDEHARGAAETLGWLDATASGFERTASLKALCERAAVAFRTLTGFDRVMVYRFLDDEAGYVVAEDRDPSLDTFLNHHFPASDIPRQARALYVRNRTRVIPTVEYDPQPIRPAAFAGVDLSDVAIRSVSPIHMQYLRNMGVGASASISIVKDGMLWGLIACHHHAPKRLSRDVRTVAAALAGGLSRQITAKEEAESYRERLALRTEEDTLLPALFGDERLDRVLARRREDLRRMMGADGFAIVGEKVETTGFCPTDDKVRKLATWVGRRDDASVFSTRELGADWEDAAGLSPFAGVLAISLPQERLTLLWLRAEEVEEVEWAGNPHKAVRHDPNATLTPRSSFETWTQTVRGRARRWTLEQVDAAQRLRRMLREAGLLGELRRVNADLSRANADKDAALAQKDLLMREVDHRVQNSLQLVASFLMLQARAAGPGEVADQLQEARSRLSAVALVHRRLYRDDQIATIDLSRYLTELLDDMRTSLGRDWGNRLSAELAPVLIPTDRAVNVGLIAAELITNATKYAYSPDQPGPIELVLEQHRNKLRLIVADQGRGKQGDNVGFGSRMMSAVVQRIGGEVEYQDNQPGLRAVLTAPIEED